MRKQALIHLHELGFELREELEAAGEVPTGTFAGYDAFGVSPAAIYRRKSAHEEALWRLLDGLTDAVSAERESTDRAVLTTTEE